MIPPTSPLTLRQYIGRVVITLALIGLALAVNAIPFFNEVT